ncbi:MAG TPA: Do family serine endopeptidase [Spirochaetia bacterium]|nr:Do family serine endopeptidase [Spirochaetia bacterium]
MSRLPWRTTNRFELARKAVVVGISLLLFAISTSVFGDPAGPGPAGLASLETTQNAFRQIAKSILPTVVEVNVVDTVNAPPASPFQFNGRNLFQYFFGVPSPNDAKPNQPPQRQFQQRGLGSGIMVRQDGDKVYVLTNNHVAGDSTQTSIRLSDGRSFKASLVGKDPQRDLALVSFTSSERMPIAPLGDSNTLEVGDWVLAVGNPLGFESSITFGIVSAVGRQAQPGTDLGQFTDYIQTDAAINRGNSGGPLVNIHGEVVGINTWIASQTGGSIGLGFAIPINNATKAIDEFISKGRVDYGWLGVNVGNVAPSVQANLSGNVNGAFVYDVFRSSAADRAGIAPGDIITRVNDVNLTTSDGLVTQIGRLDPGKSIRLSVYRDGRTVNLTVTLGVRSADLAKQAKNLWPGMSVVNLTDEVRTQLNLPSGHGDVVIGNVESASPADTAGLKPGDIIRDVNGNRIRNVMEFYKAMNNTRSNEVMFRIYRQDTELLIGLVR